ncbi:MAG: hypothetical protein Q8P60_06365 [Pseudorhodobacter sp.]|nr:hypothetical protein [Pseudorhodobacter sp.]
MFTQYFGGNPAHFRQPARIDPSQIGHDEAADGWHEVWALLRRHGRQGWLFSKSMGHPIPHRGQGQFV